MWELGASSFQGQDDIIIRFSQPSRMMLLCFRGAEQVTVPSVHDLRAEELPGGEAVRESVVLRQSARLQVERICEEETSHRHKTRLLGVVSGRARVHLQVSIKYKSNLAEATTVLGNL